MHFVLLVVFLFMVFINIDAQNSIAFVFVPGPFDSPSIWNNVVLLLRGQFAKVTVALPTDNASFSNYVQEVVTVVKQQGVQVVLCGHGFAGAIISGVADLIPNQILSLVYVSAFIPKNGDTVLSALQNSQLGPYLVPDPSGQFVTASTGAEAVVFNNCEPGGTVFNDDVAALTTRKEPLSPLQAVIQLGTNFTNSIKIAILTGADTVIPPDIQFASIYAANNVARSFALPLSGFMPMICQPRELARIFQEIAVSSGVTVGSTVDFFSGRDRDIVTGGRSRGNMRG